MMKTYLMGSFVVSASRKLATKRNRFDRFTKFSKLVVKIYTSDKCSVGERRENLSRL